MKARIMLVENASASSAAVRHHVVVRTRMQVAGMSDDERVFVDDEKQRARLEGRRTEHLPENRTLTEATI